MEEINVPEQNPEKVYSTEGNGQEISTPTNALVVQWKRPYTFEGHSYTEVDLIGLDTLTIQDAIETQKQLFGRNELAGSMLSETTMSFACAIAARVSGKPIEFFQMMPCTVSRQVQRAIFQHLNVENTGKITLWYCASCMFLREKCTRKST